MYAQDGELDIQGEELGFTVALVNGEPVELEDLLRPYIGQRVRLRITVEPLPPKDTPLGLRT